MHVFLDFLKWHYDIYLISFHAAFTQHYALDAIILYAVSLLFIILAY